MLLRFMVVDLNNLAKWSLIYRLDNLVSICNMIADLVSIKLIGASIISISLLIASTWYEYTLAILLLIQPMILLLFTIIFIISFSCTFGITINGFTNLDCFSIFYLPQEINPFILLNFIYLFSRKMVIILT